LCGFGEGEAQGFDRGRNRLSDHLTSVEAQLLLEGKLSSERARPVVAHLLRGCQRCKALVARQLPELADDEPAEPELSPNPNAAYDAAIERTLDTVPRCLRGFSSYESFLAQSWAVRHDNPAEMIRLAMLAAIVVGKLNPKHLGAKRVADLACRARIELGNAYRVADRLEEAGSALRLAVESFREGTGNQELQARLFDVHASLCADRRQFSRASKALTLVHAIHAKRGSKHHAGRALVCKGLYQGLANDPEGALRLLNEGFRIIDFERDPHLALACIHNTARFMRDCGRFREARAFLFENLWRYEAHGGFLDRLKLKWVQGQIDQGLGELDCAESDFLEVRDGLTATDLRLTAAIAALDLAVVWVRLGRSGEAKDLAFETVNVLLALGIHREALIALMILRNALGLEIATSILAS
jgi:tetratricopeptide (TPR) repeat protein